MFFLFSNKLGCLGSLLISGILTLILLALLGVINFGGGGGSRAKMPGFKDPSARALHRTQRLLPFR